MSYIKKLNRKLQERFHGSVQAFERDGCLVLQGALEQWDDVVSAGLLAVNRRCYDGLVNDIIFTGGVIPPMRLPALQDQALDGVEPDVLIIGGGIVGCAIARECARYEMSVLLVEKEHDVAMQSSGRNDGMVHPGVDLIPGQIKRRYNMRGNRMYDQICSELDVPFCRSGQYLCFQSKGLAFAAYFAQVYYKLFGPRCRYLGHTKFIKREPNMNQKIQAALFFPDAGVVSPYGLTIAYAENAVDNGVRLSLDTAVLDMKLDAHRIVSVSTNRGTIYPKIVINAAGVFSEEIARMANDRFFSIHPRKGTNTILDHKAAKRMTAIVSSFGTSSTKKKHTKGGGLVKTIDDNTLVGPDAVETYRKEDFSTAAQNIADVFEKQRMTDPALSLRDAITYFSGIRAATYEEDFVIRKGRRTENIVHAAGIQSPGITAAPAIAVDVSRMAAELLAKTREVRKNPEFNPIRKAILRPNELSDQERDQLIHEQADYGEIICRCEQVSRGEVKAALHRSVPCDTLDGVKRRVRPGMGRCQGGFCGPLVLQIIAEETGMPLEQIDKNAPGGELLFGTIKEVQSE
ncbi:MAG: NAD(P)/FAD-dependent oxidoreductase [Eubacteriales bacterium]|nr:NAD(P)/FAD-dependent oxidoreductase [Eubacteriales bacterium]